MEKKTAHKFHQKLMLKILSAEQLREYFCKAKRKDAALTYVVTRRKGSELRTAQAQLQSR